MKQLQNKDNNSLRKIDWGIVTFLIQQLYQNPYAKKTNLAMKTGLQYSRFMRYLKWLQFVKWIEIVEKDGFNVIILSKTGMEIYKELHMLN